MFVLLKFVKNFCREVFDDTSDKNDGTFGKRKIHLRIKESFLLDNPLTSAGAKHVYLDRCIY